MIPEEMGKLLGAQTYSRSTPKNAMKDGRMWTFDNLEAFLDWELLEWLRLLYSLVVKTVNKITNEMWEENG